MGDNNKFKLIPLDTLKLQLIDQLRKRGFAESTIHCIEVEIRHLQEHFSKHQLSGYHPEIGIVFLKEFFDDGAYSEKAFANYHSLIRRLDDLYYGRDFTWRHSSKQSEAPSWCKAALSKYLENCKGNGNTDKSIIRKEVACRKFFIRLADAGCNCIDDVDAVKVQSSVLSEDAESSHAFVREMLCFLAMAGIMNADYSTLVPKIHRKAKLPTTYNKEELECVENSVDTTTAIGKRDFAIILLATRLGIRAGDIAGMTFDYIDFGRDRLCFVQGKTKSPIELVLLPEVKNALKDYIESGRPESSSNYVFLSFRNPYRVIDRTLVHALTTRYLKKAGVDCTNKKHGPHSFRSSLATAMVNNGMPYDVARKVLGHEDPESIKYYANLDIENLRKCAINVPAAKGIFARYLSGKERG